MGTQVHYKTCPLCEATCGLEIHLSDGEILTIRGDKEDPLSRGYMCPKGFGLKGIHEDPDRVKVPMIRSGTTWSEVTFEEAFEYIRQRIAAIRQQHGSDAVALYMGNPNVHNLDAQVYLSAVARAVGSKNRFSATTIDQLPKQLVAAHLYGHPMSVPVPDVDRCKYFLILGANPLVSNGSMMTAPNMRDRLRALQARGGKVVVVDPVRTRTAATADEHQFIRPGTDAWFLLGMLCTLFEENLVSYDRLAPYVHGQSEIESLARRVTPEQAQAYCNVSATDIRRIAREFAACDAACAYGRMGTCTQEFGTLTTWLIDVLNIVTGNLDRPGGPMFSLAAAASANVGGSSGRSKGVRMGRYHSRVRGLPEVLGELPVAVMAEEMDTPGEGQVKALITVAGNPVLSTPDSQRLRAAIQGLDFMVSVDFYLNETTSLADVFLPVPSPLERHHYDLTFYQLSVRNIAHYSPPVYALSSDQLEEWEVLLHLAAALNDQAFDDNWPTKADDAMVTSTISGAIGESDEQKRQGLVKHALGQLGERRGPTRFVDLLIRSGPYGDGFGERQGGLNMDGLMRAPHGVDLGALAPRIPEVIRTPSGVIELAPQRFVADVERLMGSSNVMDKAQQDQSLFSLVGRRILQSNNSWMHNIQTLYKGIMGPSLWMNPRDAQRHNVQEGDMVEVTSDAGHVCVKVSLTDTVMPGVVSLPHGFGHEEESSRLGVATVDPGVNYNQLSSVEHIDLLSGNAAVNGTLVSISKVSASAKEEPASRGV